MTTKKRTPKSASMRFLEEISGDSLTMGGLLLAIREGEELSQIDFSSRLDISKSHLCDIEKGRKTVSPARASEFAKKLGYSQDQFVQLALQSLVDEANLDLKVNVEAA
jgi:transcriptional regulator with XRE-family HTH domain